MRFVNEVCVYRGCLFSSENEKLFLCNGINVEIVYINDDMEEDCVSGKITYIDEHCIELDDNNEFIHFDDVRRIGVA